MVNKNVKYDRIARAVIQSEADLWNLMIGALRRLQKAPQIVRAFFRDPALRYIRTAET
jgi:hypothetical protein